MNIPVDRTTSSRLDQDAVRSGRLTNVPSDHMFIAEYAHGEWRKARVQPYRPIPLSPHAIGLHYAQAVFEGMKAYRYDDDTIAVFRMERHHDRLQKSLARMCMPEIPYELFESAMNAFVDTDRDWVPDGPDATFYLRPLVFATEAHVGLKPAEEFMLLILGAPFRPIFRGPLRVKVERQYVRAAPGGVGSAKCAGNYAAAMYPTKLAKDAGFDQVLWTDAMSHQNIEESGAMNVMFVINGSVVTPPLSDTILNGVTRESILTLARDMGMQADERTVSVDEIRDGIASGSVTEAFGVGTAAVVAPIGTISIDDVDISLPTVDQPLSLQLKTRLNDIRFGKTADTYGWMNVVESVGAKEVL